MTDSSLNILVSKKHVLILALLLVFFDCIYCQVNFVPNGDFEQTIGCPTLATQGAFSVAAGWSDFCGSPDLFHTCAGTSTYGVPNNYTGHQHPASGSGYAGIHIFDSVLTISETMGAKLSNTLSIGTTYYLSMKVSLAEWFYDNTSLFLPCNNIGMKFSKVPFTFTNCPPRNGGAHLNSTAIISDTANWQLVQGKFVADSAYQYLSIGDFYSRASTRRASRIDGYRSYFYIDDIIVSPDSTVMDYTGIEKYHDNEHFSIFPSPATDQIFVRHQGSPELINISIKNLWGEIVLNKTVNSDESIEIGNLIPAIYVAEIGSGKRRVYFKIVKN